MRREVLVPVSLWRKKPIVVKALCWNGHNQAEVADFMGVSPAFGSDTAGAAWVEISTLEGVMRADRGDWIVKGPFGEHYPVKPDIFAATYEQAEQPA